MNNRIIRINELNIEIMATKSLKHNDDYYCNLCDLNEYCSNPQLVRIIDDVINCNEDDKRRYSCVGHKLYHEYLKSPHMENENEVNVVHASLFILSYERIRI